MLKSFLNLRELRPPERRKLSCFVLGLPSLLLLVIGCGRKQFLPSQVEGKQSPLKKGGRGVVFRPPHVYQLKEFLIQFARYKGLELK
jgi:hypothetical protein